MEMLRNSFLFYSRKFGSLYYLLLLPMRGILTSLQHWCEKPRLQKLLFIILWTKFFSLTVTATLLASVRISDAHSDVSRSLM